MRTWECQRYGVKMGRGGGGHSDGGMAASVRI